MIGRGPLTERRPASVLLEAISRDREQMREIGAVPGALAAARSPIARHRVGSSAVILAYAPRSEAPGGITVPITVMVCSESSRPHIPAG
jgi:hypothetical protein